MTRFHPRALVESPKIGKRTRVWAFAHVMERARVGADCNIGECSFIENGAVLGDRVTLKNGVSVWDGVVIEDDVFVGPNAVFTNDMWPISRRPFSDPVKTRVRKGACIGANATVICGITIGEYAFLGAGAVATKDIPGHALATGNPARVTGFLCGCRKKLHFRGGKAKCASCRLGYRKAGNKVARV